MTDKLGIVTAASLEKGVDVRLDAPVNVEDMVVGRYVTIEGQKRRFFGMITNVSLNYTDERLSVSPPDVSNPFMRDVLTGTSTFGQIHVTPMLTIGGEVNAVLGEPQPVKTIPAHFSAVNLATEQDMETVFGEEDQQRFFIGNPLDMETRLCLNLEEFVKRSNGIFGKSGTGKTFLTRILLIGMLQKSKAVNLIFDMHNEYGWQGTYEGKGGKVHGLKHWGQSRVALYSLDEISSQRRGYTPDFVVKIGYSEIEPEDLSLLRETLGISDLAVEAAYQLERRFKKDWISRVLAMESGEDTKELLDEMSIHESTFGSLKRGLNTISRLPFIEPKSTRDAVKNVLDHLDRGVNVVLEFGRYQDFTSYILVANMLARRIYTQYQARTEKAMAEDSAKPNPLVITIEEAHKFLNPEVAGQTIFGTIAREMRKYNVTLLVIDQRPSGIYEDIMSQLGTKITCLLDNEKDIDSVLAGVSGKNELKSVLARLAPKQQALIFGHAVPMPVAFQPREYGSARSYAGFGAAESKPSSTAVDKKPVDDNPDKLWE
jgi:uncharacterized protein